MLKKITFIAIAIVFSLSVIAQSTPQKVSEKVTVTFPGKPEEQKLPNNASIYTFKRDSTQMLMGMSIDLSPMGLTTEIIQSQGDALWDQMVGGMTQQMPGAIISKNEKTTFKGQSGVFLEIDGTNSTAPNLKGRKAFAYLFFIDASLHQFAFYSSNKDAKVSDEQAFFDSVTIQK